MGPLARRWTRCLASPALLLLLVSCAASSDSPTVDAPASPPAALTAHWPGCRAVGAFSVPSSTSPAGSGSIPAGFQPRVAVLCSPSEGSGRTGRPVDLERRATQISPLLDYIRRPSRQASRPDHVACPAMGWTPPRLFLVDGAGTWMVPEIPTDACHFPLDLFHTDHLPWEQLAYTDRVVPG